jgi:spoIIIJ-associated protein
MAQRFEGKNIEEALDSAVESLGVERYKLLYHVVLEKRGFLGGMKRVVIEAEVNEAAVEPEQPRQQQVSAEPRMADVAEPAQSMPAAPRQRTGGRERGGREQRPRGGAGHDDGRQRRGGRGRSRPDDRDAPRQSRGPARDYQPLPAEDIPPQAAESEKAIAVREWCARVIELAGLDLELRTTETETQIGVRLYGHDTARLVDRNGELLDAIQVLANKALVGRSVEKDVELDAAAFKEKRLEDLSQRARSLADEVRTSGREQLLPAMSPIERRIIHLTLQDDAQVMTESRGEGFYKRVVVKLRTSSDQPSES